MHASFDFEIYSEKNTFNSQDYSDWLRTGIRFYLGRLKLPSTMRMADAFEPAKLFIGRNEGDLAEDFADVYRALPGWQRVSFERGIAIAFANLEFREAYEYEAAEILLTLACRVRARAIIECLSGVLPLLTVAEVRSGSGAESAAKVRKLAFQAALELAANSTESVLCIERFVLEDAQRGTLFESMSALEVLRYLGRGAKDKLPYWCAILGNPVVREIDGRDVRAARARLEESYGAQDVQRVVDMVRIDAVRRLATEREALSEASMHGLRNLISRLDPRFAQGRAADRSGPPAQQVDPSEPSNGAGSANVIPFDKYFQEYRGR